MVNQAEKNMTRTLQTGTCNIFNQTTQTNTNITDCRLQIVDLLNLKSEIGNPKSGFTLIELIVVIFIISLATALIMPSFWGTEKTAVKTEARHISSALRYIYDEAVAKKQIYVLDINLDEESWGFKSKNESRRFEIKDNVEIRDVIIPSHGEISRGEVIIEFGPMGPDEPIIVHLKKGESEYTIIFNQLNGRTKIIEGYTL